MHGLAAVDPDPGEGGAGREEEEEETRRNKCREGWKGDCHFLTDL